MVRQDLEDEVPQARDMARLPTPELGSAEFDPGRAQHVDPGIGPPLADGRVFRVDQHVGENLPAGGPLGQGNRRQQGGKFAHCHDHQGRRRGQSGDLGADPSGQRSLAGRRQHPRHSQVVKAWRRA